MSLDLGRLYEGMGHEADGVELPPPESIRRRGRRRRNRVLGGAASVLSVLLIFSVGWTALAPGPESVAEPAFLPFDGDAPPVVRFEDGLDFGMTATLGDTSYAMWIDKGRTERAAAIDLRTLKPLWGPVTIGKYGDTNGMVISQGAILLLTEQGEDARSDQIVALDPATGKVMWRLDYSFNDTDRVLYDDVLVISWPDRSVVEALDLKTGRPVWTVTARLMPHATNAMRSFGEFAGARTPADRRFVMRLDDGTVQIRSVDTGEVLREIPGASGQGRVVFEVAVDGMLYSVRPDGVTEIDLEQPRQPRKVFQGEAKQLAPCGAAVLCVLSTELVLIDTRKARELWRRSAEVTRAGVSATGGGIVVPTTEGFAVYDLTGKRLVAAPGVARWVDDGHLLAFEPDRVSAYKVATGERTVLGRARGMSCSWNSTMLTCPTDEGIRVWRYRASE